MDNIYSNRQYLDNNLTWHEEDAPFKISNVIKLSEQLFRDKLIQKVLDVGCGSGKATEIMASFHQDVSFLGIDLSADASELWIKRNKLKNLDFQLANVEDSIDVDLAVCLDIIEHVDDYIGFIKTVKSKSKYQIWNIPLEFNALGSIFSSKISESRKTYGHIHYFSTSTGLETLDYCGLEIKKFIHIDPYNDPEWVKNNVNTTRRQIARIVKRVTRFLPQQFVTSLLGGKSLMVLTQTKSM